MGGSSGVVSIRAASSAILVQGPPPRALLRRHGAQVQPVQEGAVHVSLEVEEEAHSAPAEEAPQDAAALEVRGGAAPRQVSACTWLRSMSASEVCASDKCYSSL